MRKTRRGQSGYAYVLVLIIAIVVTMLAMTLITNTTAGIAGEAKRYAADRARMNSESGLTLTEFKLKKEVPKLLKQIVMQANEDDRFGGQMALSTLRFEPMNYSWGPLPGEGNTAEDTAEVRVEITLPGPPTVTNTSGLPSGPEVGTVETYCFVAHLTAAGHSTAGTTWTSEKMSNIYVTLVLGEVESSVLSGLGSGNVIEVTKGDGPMFDERDRRAWWDPTPVAYAAEGLLTIGSATLSTMDGMVLSGGSAPAAGWNGEPQIVSGPTQVGLTNGDAVYYWYVRGLATGTHVTEAADDTPGAIAYILAVDSWRYSPSYRASDDTVPTQEGDNLVIYRKGTPNYGVVAIQVPPGVDGARARNQSVVRSIYIPGYGTKKFEVQSVPAAPITTDIIGGPLSRGFTIVGWPSGSDAIAYAGVVEPHDFASELNLRADSYHTIEQFLGGIEVPGNMAPGGHTVGATSHASATEPGMIPLVIVTGIRADVTMSYKIVSGRETATTRNSGHAVMPFGSVDLGGGEDIIVDPPPPGGRSKVRIVAIMYIPLWIAYVPNIDGSRGAR